MNRVAVCDEGMGIDVSEVFPDWKILNVPTFVLYNLFLLEYIWIEYMQIFY